MMKRFSMMALIAALLLSSIQLFAANPSVDEILQKNIKARGGDKIKTVTSITTEMSMELMGMSVPMKTFIKYPDKMRSEISMMGMTVVTIFNGNKGWTIQAGSVQEIPADMVAAARNQSDNQSGMLCKTYIDYKALGVNYEFIGIEDVKGTPAYKLKQTLKDGSVSFIFFSTKDYLELKITAKDPESKEDTDIFFTENKTFDGYLLPTKMQSTMKNMAVNISITSYKFNDKIEDSMFQPK